MIQQILEIIRSAGQIMLQAHDIDNGIDSKQGSANFVTRYDVEVQEFLRKSLKELVPDADFIGEEGEEEKLYSKQNCFIIDPIDGTTNFIFDYRHSSISVAWLQNGAVVFGAVYNPYLDELFYAEKGRGAYLQRRNRNISTETDNIYEERAFTETDTFEAAGVLTSSKDNRSSIRTELKLTVKNLKLSEGIAGFGTSPYYRELTEKSFELAKKIFQKALDIRRTGSAALDLSYVAAGRYVLFAEYVLQPWDYAAASLIVQEAGGRITTLDGEELTYDKPCSILAGGPKAYGDFFLS